MTEEKAKDNIWRLIDDLGIEITKVTESVSKVKAHSFYEVTELRSSLEGLLAAKDLVNKIKSTLIEDHRKKS